MGRRWPLTLRGAGALLLALGCVIAAGRVGLAELLWFALLLVALVAGCLVWVRFVPRGLPPAKVPCDFGL